MNTAMGLVTKELGNLLKARAMVRERHLTIMKTIIDCASWREIVFDLRYSDHEIFNRGS